MKTILTNFKKYNRFVIGFVIGFMFCFNSFGQSGIMNDYNPWNVDIPDYGGNHVCSDLGLIVAPSNAIITKVKVYYEIRHTYPGDLDVWLTSYYNGSWHDYYLYHYGDLGSTDNIVETRDNIHAWDGALANQTWYLCVLDNATGDIGYIDFFQVWVTYCDLVDDTWVMVVEQNTCEYAYLDWYNCTDNVQGFRIERDGNEIANLSASASDYTDNSVSEGYHEYCVYAYNDCSQSYSCGDVTVKEESVSPSSASASPNPVCSGNSTTLSKSGGSLGTGASWKWYKNSCGGTYIGTGSSVSVSPTSTTTYYVRAEGDCNTTSCASVTVTNKTNSTAPTSASASPNPVCSGNSTTLSKSGGSLGTGASWKWYKNSCGGTYVGSGSSVSVSPTTTTTYYVRAEGDCNTTSCASVTVIVNPLPTAQFSTSSTTINEGDCINFIDQSTNTTSWSWTFTGATPNSSTSQNPINICYNTQGTYTVTLTATNSCGADTETKTNYISVYGNSPIADFTGTPTSGTESLTVQFTDQSSNSPTSWSWNFGDSDTSTDQNPTHTYNNLGNYTVSLTATNSYGDDTETKTDYISVIVGIEDIETDNQINIYPNPTNGTLIIEASIDINYIKIYDLIGSLVYENKFKPEINISHFDEGIYLLKLYSKEGEILKTEKIIVNK